MSQRLWRVDQSFCVLITICARLACEQLESIIWHMTGSRVYMHGISYKQKQSLKSKGNSISLYATELYTACTI